MKRQSGARREFGNVGLVKEVTRDIWGWRWLEDLYEDARFGARMLQKNPGFTLVATLSLALGIGATTAVFSVIYGVLVNPYPYANSDRMVHLTVHETKGNPLFINLSGPQLQQLRQAGSVESVAAMSRVESHDHRRRSYPKTSGLSYLTSNSFIYFGVPTLLGRGLLPSDAPEGQDPENVAVLGYQFWQRHYNGDPDIVGKKIQLVHKSYEIVGVVRPQVYLGRRRSLSAAQTHRRSGSHILSHDSAQARRNPCGGKCRAPVAARTIRKANA